MIRIFIAYDEQNGSHGSYFEESKEYLTGFVEAWDSDLHCMNCSDCTRKYVNETLPTISCNMPFVFTVLSHGNEKACVAGGKNYIDELNADKFSKSLFYSTACLNGKELGVKLIEKGCSAFVGFTEESNALYTEEHKNIFMRCDFACLFSFLMDDGRTLKEAMLDAITYYNSEIDKLDTIKDVLAKGLLINNRETITLLGNDDLKRGDLVL